MFRGKKEKDEIENENESKNIYFNKAPNQINFLWIKTSSKPY